MRRYKTRLVALVGLLIAYASVIQAEELGYTRNAIRLPNAYISDGVTFFEEIGDDRASNTVYPGSSGNLPLRFDGSRRVRNGSTSSRGPFFQAGNAPRVVTFPYVQMDENRKLLLLHPGTYGTSNRAASVGYWAERSALYRFSGAFARANDARLAGDGVNVAAIKNLDSNNPLFSASIGSDHEVDFRRPFEGTSVEKFDFTIYLRSRDAVRFVVYSGPQSVDGTFDVTALKLSVEVQASPSAVQHDGNVWLAKPIAAQVPGSMANHMGSNERVAIWANQQLSIATLQVPSEVSAMRLHCGLAGQVGPQVWESGSSPSRAVSSRTIEHPWKHLYGTGAGSGPESTRSPPGLLKPYSEGFST